MIKPITGQYECVHRSGIGLDYFTSRIDRLTLYPDGRFLFIVQDRSRAASAAQSLINKQQLSTQAVEVRGEGTFQVQGPTLMLLFQDGSRRQGQISPNGDGIQLEKDLFNKISDSTVLPSANRMKADMDDIARGLKIAGTLGGMALKAAKTVQETLQQPSPTPPQSSYPAQGSQSSSPATSQAASGNPPSTYSPPTAGSPTQSQGYPSSANVETLYCDQCGTPARSGKRFCNHCGAALS